METNALPMNWMLISNADMLVHVEEVYPNVEDPLLEIRNLQ